MMKTILGAAGAAARVLVVIASAPAPASSRSRREMRALASMSSHPVRRDELIMSGGHDQDLEGAGEPRRAAASGGRNGSRIGLGGHQIKAARAGIDHSGAR